MLKSDTKGEGVVKNRSKNRGDHGHPFTEPQCLPSETLVLWGGSPGDLEVK